MKNKTQKVILLDRDGVINHDSDNYIKSATEWLPIKGSIEAIVKLSNAGFEVFVITNQSGLGRGLFSLAALEAMHSKMCGLVNELGGRISHIYYCPHTPDDQCQCRKPSTGLLDQLINDTGYCVENVVFVGDSMKDLQLAKAVNARGVLVTTGKGEKTLGRLKATVSDEEQALINLETDVYSCLMEFVKTLNL